MQKVRQLLKSKVTKNAVWMIGSSVLHKLIAFLVGIWTARFLGPANYGLIQYASAFTTFFFSISTLGLNAVIVKHLVERPKDEGVTMGTMLVLQSAASLMSIGIIVLMSLATEGNDPLTVAVVTLCSVGLLFQMMDSIKYWFQAHLESKYPSVAAIIAYIVASLYRIVLLVNGKSVLWFALATTVDYLCVALILFAVYFRKQGPRLSFSWQCAQNLLGDGCHYILSGLMVSVYAATDKLMLKHMIGEAAVGYYGTAIGIANLWTFVLTALVDSFTPVLVQLHNVDRIAFSRKNRQLYAIVFYCAMAVSAVIFILAPWAVGVLYGEAYLPVVAPLRIIVWYVAFSYLGVARNAWIVCEKAQKHLTVIYLCAAVMNIALNYLLIPGSGVDGAAIASLMTQMGTIVVFPAMVRELRPNVYLMIDAVLLRKLK